MFIHIPSVVKPVQVFCMVRNRVSKSCLMVELCFHRFLYFDCVLIYIYIYQAKKMCDFLTFKCLCGLENVDHVLTDLIKVFIKNPCKENFKDLTEY